MGCAVISGHLENAVPKAPTHVTRAPFGSDIATSEIRQGDGEARIDHRTAEIERTRAAGRDDPVIIVDILLLAHDRCSGDEARELRRGLFSASPTCAAALAILRQLGRIDPEKPHRNSAEIERIPVGRAGGPLTCCAEAGSAKRRKAAVIVSLIRCP